MRAEPGVSIAARITTSLGGPALAAPRCCPCERGPVLFRAVCLVRAIAPDEFSLQVQIKWCNLDWDGMQPGQQRQVELYRPTKAGYLGMMSVTIHKYAI